MIYVNRVRVDNESSSQSCHQHTLLFTQAATCAVSSKSIISFSVGRMAKVDLASEMPPPAPIRILDQPIFIQHTADRICVLLMCAKGACILLNQVT